jgi:hypothetical protein
LIRKFGFASRVLVKVIGGEDILYFCHLGKIIRFFGFASRMLAIF